MSTTTSQTPQRAPQRGAKRPPRLHLPFENKRSDAGEWAYDHRLGLCITLIVYLVVAIAFVSSKIVIGGRATETTVYIDLNTLADLEEERDRLEEEVRRRQQEQQFDWDRVQNTTSNENVLNENLKTDRGNQASQLNADAAAAAERMRANRAAYEQGLSEAEAIRHEGDKGQSKEGKREDKKVAGYVTVRLDIKNPVRRERELLTPAFQCEGGGEVVVEVEVRPNGEVASARVLSGGDDYMREIALRAARSSTVNIDPSAPERQKGTITYLFIPQ